MVESTNASERQKQSEEMYILTPANQRCFIRTFHARPDHYNEMEYGNHTVIKRGE